MADGTLLEELKHIRSQLQVLLGGQARLEESLNILCGPATKALPLEVQEVAICNDEAQQEALQIPVDVQEAWRLKARIFSTDGSPDTTGRHNAKKTGRMRTVCDVMITPSDGERARRGRHLLQRMGLPLRPDSRTRLIIDMVGMALLLYDSLMVPFIIAWEKSVSGFFLVSACVTVIFWTFDLSLNFATCVTKDDTLLVKWSAIAKNYLRSWFFLDFGIVSLDWSAIFLELIYSNSTPSGTFYLKLVRLLKAVRVVRIMAMLRAGKFAQVEDALLRQAHLLGGDMHFSFTMGISKLVLVILWLNHIGSCVWWIFVKSEMTDTGQSWSRTLAASLNIEDVSHSEHLDGYWYVAGLYWSVTAMFSCTSQMAPSNSYEASFALVYVVFGMLFGSTLISSVAAMLVEFQVQRRDQQEKLRLLRKFLQQHQVDPLLTINIQKQVLERISHEKRLANKDVPVLGLLSTHLRVALWYEIYAPVLTQHTFLGICDHIDDALLKDITSVALGNVTINPGQELFKPHTSMEQAYVLFGGLMHYTPQDEMEILPDPLDVMPQEWICEMALWTHWATRGLMESGGSCEVLVIRVASLAEVLVVHPEVARVVQDYSATLCQVVKDDGVNLSDLSTCCRVDDDHVFCAMPQESRILMSMPALDAVINTAGYSEAKLRNAAALEDEVRQGKCNLRQTPQGKVLRVVQLVAVRLVRTDGLLCAIVGEWGATDAKPTASVPRLPGTKLRRGELVGQALERFCSEELVLLEPAVRGHGEVELEERPSDSYGVTTRYVRTVFTAATAACPAMSALLARDASGGGGTVEIFVVSTAKGGNRKFYAWLAEEDFHGLASRKGQALQQIADWIQRFSWKAAGIEVCQ